MNKKRVLSYNKNFLKFKKDYESFISTLHVKEIYFKKKLYRVGDEYFLIDRHLSANIDSRMIANNVIYKAKIKEINIVDNQGFLDCHIFLSNGTEINLENDVYNLFTSFPFAKKEAIKFLETVYSIDVVKRIEAVKLLKERKFL